MKVGMIHPIRETLVSPNWPGVHGEATYFIPPPQFDGAELIDCGAVRVAKPSGTDDGNRVLNALGPMRRPSMSGPAEGITGV